MLSLLATGSLTACETARETSIADPSPAAVAAADPATAPVPRDASAPADASPEGAPEPRSEERVEAVTPTDESIEDAAQEKVVEPPRWVDPGALAVAQLFEQVIADRFALPDPDRELRIGLMEIRNLSRSTPREFEALLSRFAALLNDAGGGTLQFLVSSEEPVDVYLGGSAYITTAGGFDWWELFLNARPADETWRFWRCEFPIRIMRHPRPGVQQVVIVRLPGRRSRD